MRHPSPAALSALLTRVIDYAGMFPPATLPCSAAAESYQKYLHSEQVWMLRWFVVNASDLEKVPASISGRLSVLAESDDLRAAALETKKILAATKPVYCELPITELPAIKAGGNFAKIRTGSVKVEGIPSVEDVAKFIVTCAELKLPFKATAGLHHAVRGNYRLTYEVDSPVAMMHGFLNVLLASCFAWHGERDLVPILSETDLKAFQFDDAKASWRNRSLTTEQIKEAREKFIHSFGSCSFEEPVEELKAVGWRV